MHAVKAITTTMYADPARHGKYYFKAKDLDRNAAKLEKDDSKDTVANHYAAATELKRKMQWSGDIVGGYTSTHTMAWVFQETTLGAGQQEAVRNAVRAMEGAWEDNMEECNDDAHALNDAIGQLQSAFPTVL